MSFNFMAAITIRSDFGAPQNIKSATVSTVSPSICHEVIRPDAMILIFLMLSFKPAFFTLLFHFHQAALQFFFAFCHKGVVVCMFLLISELISGLISFRIDWLEFLAVQRTLESLTHTHKLKPSILLALSHRPQ